MKRKVSPPPSEKKKAPARASQVEVLPAEISDAPPPHEAEHDEEDDPDHEPEKGEIEAASSTLPARPDPESEDLDPVERGSALSISDPLKRYMEEVKRYTLLAPEEEFGLAMKLRNEGDLQAAKALVSANLRLVVKIAFEYRSMYANVLDLIQEGNIGLMKAVSKFDPAKGARLGYYSSWWIRSYILKYLLDNFRLVKVGTTQAQKKLFYHLMREKERLEAQGLLPAPKLLAEKLHVREKDVVAMEHRLGASGAEVSVDAPMYDSGGEGRVRTFGESLADGHEAADQQMEREELLRMLRARLPAFKKELNERESRLLEDRLLAEEPKTLQEVADLYGLTRERARQIEAKLIDKLRAFLAKDLGA
jgi:RNA polymerase sigma-32 factor